MMITADSQVILLLCSYLGLPPKPDPAPLTLREWNPIASKLQSVSMTPGELFDLSEQDLKDQFDLSTEGVQRLSRLLDRRGSLSIELERLDSIGIRLMTRADPDYPQRYRQRLKQSAPTVLFYAGNKDLLGQPGIAVVGSRNLDQVGQECAALIGNACAWSGMVLYSGGAKGVDKIAMYAALDGRGTACGILADSLEKTIRAPQTRQALMRGDLCLATAYTPNAGFSVGAAMGRNKLIYTLADYAIVVASEVGKGGTWAGATEALRSGWIPVFALDYPELPEGNQVLIQKGGLSLPYSILEDFSKLLDWLKSQTSQRESRPKQLGFL